MIQLNLIEVLSIPIIHYIADFILQTDKEAKGKSKNWNDLLSHTITYSIYYFCVGVLLVLLDILPNILFVCYFTIITFVCHTITDYFTSRWVKKSFEIEDHHNGFAKIGFDQYILHLPQLFLTYALLKQYL